MILRVGTGRARVMVRVRVRVRVRVTIRVRGALARRVRSRAMLIDRHPTRHTKIRTMLLPPYG